MGDNKIWGIFQWVLLAVLLVGCDLQKQSAEQEQGAGEANDASVGQRKVVVSAVQQDLGSHPGKLLHDANCISCHDTGAYQSGVRKVNEFPALLAQVQRCDANLNPRLSNDDIVQITDYLNQAFYRYDKL